MSLRMSFSRSGRGIVFTKLSTIRSSHMPRNAGIQKNDSSRFLLLRTARLNSKHLAREAFTQSVKNDCRAEPTATRFMKDVKASKCSLSGIDGALLDFVVVMCEYHRPKIGPTTNVHHFRTIICSATLVMHHSYPQSPVARSDG